MTTVASAVAIAYALAASWRGLGAAAISGGMFAMIVCWASISTASMAASSVLASDTAVVVALFATTIQKMNPPNPETKTFNSSEPPLAARPAVPVSIERSDVLRANVAADVRVSVIGSSGDRGWWTGWGTSR